MTYIFKGFQLYLPLHISYDYIMNGKIIHEITWFE